MSVKVKSVKEEPFDSKGNYRGPAIKNKKTGKYEWAGNLKSGSVNET